MGRRSRMAAPGAGKKQDKVDVVLISDIFPKVARIAISMTYTRTGVLEPLSRSVNFSPGSKGVLKVSCLCSDCAEGVFDFTKIITSMVSARKTSAKGEISCDNCTAPECINVAYSMTIAYTTGK